MKSLPAFLILMLFLSMNSNPASGQEIKVKVRQGVPEYPSAFCFRPDGEQLVVLGLDKIVFFNSRTGLEEHTIDSLEKKFPGFFPKMISFTADGKLLYALGDLAKVVWWHADTYRVSHSRLEDPTEVIEPYGAFEKHFIYLNKGEVNQRLFFASAHDGHTLHMTNMGVLKESSRYLMPGIQPYIDNEGMFMIDPDNTLYDLKKAATINIADILKQHWSTTKLAVSGKKQLLAIAHTKMLTKGGQEYIPQPGNQAEIIRKRTSGEFLIRNDVDIVDIRTKQVVCSFAAEGLCLNDCHNEATMLAFSPDGNFLLYGSKTSLKVWDLEKKLLQYELPEGIDVNTKPEFSSNGRLFAVLNQGRLSVYDLQTGIETTSIGTFQPVLYNSKLASFDEQAGILTIRNGKEGIIKHLDLNQNAIALEKKSPFSDPEFSYKEVIKYSKLPNPVKIDTSQFSTYFIKNMIIDNIVAKTKDHFMVLRRFNWLKATVDTLITCRVPKDFNMLTRKAYNADSSMLAIDDNDYVGVFNLRSHKFIFGAAVPKVANYIFSDKSCYLFVLDTEGKIRMFDCLTGRMLCEIFQFGEKGSLLISGNNYWANSEAIQYSSFQYRNRSYLFEQFDKRFNRPDIILQQVRPSNTSLISAYKRTYQLRNPGHASAQESPFSLPSVKIIGEAAIPHLTSDPLLKFSIEIDGHTDVIQKVLVYANGVPVREIVINKPMHKTMLHLNPLSLASGKNRIKILAFDRSGIASPAEELFISYHPLKPQKRQVFLALIGIDTYEHFPALPGTEASLDSVAAHLKKRLGDSVTLKIREIKGKVVNRANFVLLKEFFSEATTDDVVILFISGHGLLSLKENEFYFATPNAQISGSISGIPFSEIYSMFGTLESRNRLFFIDACFSGKNAGSSDPLVKEAYTLLNAQFTDTEERNGVYVISASSGENTALGNSAGGLLSQAVIATIDEQTHMNSDKLSGAILSYFEKFREFNLPVPELKHSNIYHSFSIW
ncbi:caspase family protein [Mucilaginibacter angelicae]|uniref:Caspase family protein n=1 Tax=Mucilaginibacter angelicae TaxID=869718 RepID=A0ABV6L124_9SPHI